MQKSWDVRVAPCADADADVISINIGLAAVDFSWIVRVAPHGLTPTPMSSMCPRKIGPADRAPAADADVPDGGRRPTASPSPTATAQTTAAHPQGPTGRVSESIRRGMLNERGVTCAAGARQPWGPRRDEELISSRAGESVIGGRPGRASQSIQNPLGRRAQWKTGGTFMASLINIGVRAW